MQMTDTLLLNLLKEGNKKALELLFIKYYSRLCTYAFDMIQNDCAAEEIVSDIFFHLWEHRQTLLITDSLQAYLYTSTKNRTLNHLRTKKVKFTNLTKVTRSHVSAIPTPYEQLNYQELQQRISEVISQLPTQRRIIVQMKCLDGLKVSQIALKLGLAESTVKSQLQSAYRYFKTHVPHLFSILLCAAFFYLFF